MDYGQFDDLTRSVVGDGGTRRAIFRLLVGGVLGGVAARLGLADVTKAKPKHKKAKGKQQRKSQVERKAQGQLRAEGKRNKKRKNKPKKPSKPSRPTQCTETFCDNGGRCCDGACVAPGECCPGEKKCGGGCIAATSCCPYDECCSPKRSCGGLACVGPGECCPSEQSCPGEGCIPDSECCELTAPLCVECQEEYCNNGSWTCIPKETPNCGECEEVACDNGTWICRPKPSLDTCQQCPDGYKRCEEGEPCIPANECCGTTEFVCANCYSYACENGNWVCNKDLTGCNCPWGASVCPNAPGRSWPLPEGGSIDLPPGCCPPGHFGWEHPSGEAKCFEEVLGSGSSEAGWICFEGW